MAALRPKRRHVIKDADREPRIGLTTNDDLELRPNAPVLFHVVAEPGASVESEAKILRSHICASVADRANRHSAVRVPKQPASENRVGSKSLLDWDPDVKTQIEIEQVAVARGNIIGPRTQHIVAHRHVRG